MELIDLLRVIRRWLWLIIAIVVVAELALWLGMRSSEPVYAATVELQISIPQREDVAAYDQSRSISPRDEITVAINNFTELLQSKEVYKRTASQLGLDEKDALYTLSAKRVTDADFVDVTVEARTPELAAEIANTHIRVATAYYGELRAQSTKAEKDLFAEQLRISEEELQAAEKALADFRTQNGIYSLDDQMSAQQRLIGMLQSERDQHVLEQAAALATIMNSPTPVAATQKTNKVTPIVTPTATPVVDLVAEVDKLIAQRMKELNQYTALAPQYNLLEQNVIQARADHDHLRSKYSEAQLKVTAVQAANFIQVIKPASAPIEAQSSWSMLAVLALAGSLCLGVVLAFLLQYLSSFKAASVTAPVPANDRKTPSRVYTGQELWKRLRNIFSRNNPANEWVGLVSSADPTAEQEPIAMQDQRGSTETKLA